MPVPTDPYDFVNGTIADGDQVDLRFKKLYDALNPAVQGLDMANFAGGAASRLLGFTTLGPYSYGSNNTAVLQSLTLTHHGKPAFVVAWHSVIVSGATPYGLAPYVFVDTGSTFGFHAPVSSPVLGEPFPFVCMGQTSALSGPHTWNFRVETGNNANTWRSPGSGGMLVFEQS